MEANSPFARFAQDQADATVALLEGNGRRIMVLIIALDDEHLGLCRAVSANTTAADAEAFLTGIDSHAGRILARLENKL